MKKTLLALISAIGLGILSHAHAYADTSDEVVVVSDFNNLDLTPESFWNGSDGSGGFASGLVRFYNDFNPDWGVWQGWSYSNMSDNETPGWMNQYSAITGAAVEGSSLYAVAYNPRSLTFVKPEPHLVKGIYVTNSTYAALSMRYGDDFSKKFGGADGTDPDWFKLSIWGMLEGEQTDTIEFFLADYRFEDNTKNYIVDTWRWVDLSSLGKVDSLLFGMSSTDVGDWGMNTPAYFSVGQVQVVENPYRTKYIAEVIEYVPAPGQFINKEPLGHPASASSIIGGTTGGLSLGAFGGYVVFRFEEPVVNHPDNPFGIDFILFGNPFAQFSEPGLVSVMKDENGNGIPDDTWYELAGSDHFFSTTKKNSRVTYHNPGEETASDVYWEDDLGQTGYVKTVSFHQQPYYPLTSLFPSVDSVSYTLSGTRIAGHLDFSNPAMIQSHPRAFGYADNRVRGAAPWHVPANPYSREVTNAGGDGFDIGWAVDSLGNYVDLDTIHFVRVHTAMLANAGWLGEISTEITGGAIVKPDPMKTGVLDMVVIRDLPPVIGSKEVALEALAFHRGRLLRDEEIIWSASLEGAYVDQEQILHLTKNGELTLTASMASNPAINDRITVLVDIDSDPTDIQNVIEKRIVLYPNPATDVVFLSGVNNATIMLYDLSGKELLRMEGYSEGQPISVGRLTEGIYLLRVATAEQSDTFRLVVGRR